MTILENKNYAGAGRYCENLDVLRLLASVAIVWIHAVQTPIFQIASNWCRFAVPAFTGISVLLLVWRRSGGLAKDFWIYVTGRATKIYALFLVWNGIYAGVRFLEHHAIIGGDNIRWSYETAFLAGFTEQLWFLPFLSLITVVVAAPAFVYTRIEGVQKWALAMLFSTVGMVLALRPSPINVNIEVHPASYWFVLAWQAAPSALIVFGILPVCIQAGKIISPRPLFGLALVFLAAFLLWLSINSKYMILLQNISGIVLVLGAVLEPFPDFLKRIAKNLGWLALPIYVLHVLFVHLIEVFGHRVAHLPISMTFDAIVILGGLFGSGLVAWVLQQIPGLKWLVTVR